MATFFLRGRQEVTVLPRRWFRSLLVTPDVTLDDLWTTDIATLNIGYVDLFRQCTGEQEVASVLNNSVPFLI
jgi:hypothetical protein